jgi:hypothetical protein
MNVRWTSPVSLPRVSRAEGAALAALSGLIALLFRDVLFHGQVFFERDVHLHFYPHAEAFARTVALGSWPVWNPYSGFGEPLLANPIMAVLYPLTWLNLLLQPWTQYTVVILFHAAWTAAGMLLLGRRLGLSTLAATTAAAVWITSGPMLSLVSVAHHFSGASWLPWHVLAADTAVTKRSTRSVIGWGVVIAAQVLTGSADQCVFSGLVVAAYVAHRLDWRRFTGPDNVRIFLTACLSLGLGLALSAAQWVPSLVLASGSARVNLSAAIRTYWSMHPASLPMLFLPLPLKDIPFRPEIQAAFFEGREPFIGSTYLGLPALGLALLAIVARRHPMTRFLVVTIAIAVLVALGRHTPAYSVLVAVMPLLKAVRYPVKFMVPVAFLWAILVGIGLDAAPALEGSRKRWAFGLTCVAAGVSLAIGLAAFIAPVRIADLVLDRGATVVPAAYLGPAGVRCLAAGFCALTVAALVTFRSQSRIALALAAIVATAELVLMHDGLNRTAPKALFSVRPPLLDFVRVTDRSRLYVYDYYPPSKSREHLGHSPYLMSPSLDTPWAGTLALRNYLFPTLLAQWGIESSYDLDYLELYPTPLAGLTRWLRVVEGTPAHTRLLQIGAVGRMVALHTKGLDDLELVATLPGAFLEPIRVFAVPGALPRAYMVEAAHVADGQPARERLVDPAFDPRHEVLLADGVDTPGRDGFEGSCLVAQWKPDRIRLRCTANRPAYAILVDAYDPGWRATVDGQAAPLLRANTAFRAVAAPDGGHDIELVYRPAGVGLGLALSALTAGLALALSWWRRER